MSDVLDPTSDDEQTARDEAAEFLEVELKGGAVDSKEIFNRARDAGIAERTHKRAKQRLGIQAKKKGFEAGWFWSLNTDEPKGATSEASDDGTPSLDPWPPSREISPKDAGQNEEGQKGATTTGSQNDQPRRGPTSSEEGRRGPTSETGPLREGDALRNLLGAFPWTTVEGVEE